MTVTDFGDAPNHAPVSIDAPAHLQPYAELRMLGESFEDIQKTRIMVENRLRSGVDSGPIAESLESMVFAERKLALAMRRSFRIAAPEVRAWAAETVGIGEHTVARLLGYIGHPVIASPYHWEGEGENRKLVADPPYRRSVSQLWSYCGHGDPTRRRRKGMTVEEAMSSGNPRAKMMTHLMATIAIKCVGSANEAPEPKWVPLTGPLAGGDSNTEAASLENPEMVGDEEFNDDAKTKQRSISRRSPYRDTYDLARIKYADREDWSLGHQHNAAIRLVGKTILRDIWLAAQ